MLFLPLVKLRFKAHNRRVNMFCCLVVVEVDPEDVEVDDGKPTEIKCISPTKPEPVLTWGFGTPDGPLPEGTKVSDDGSRVKIPKCTQNHNGKWFCTGTNEHGSDTKPATVVVGPGRTYKNKCYECSATHAPTTVISLALNQLHHLFILHERLACQRV